MSKAASKSAQIQELREIASQLKPEHIKDLDPKVLAHLRKQLNPYGTTIEGKGQFLTFSYTNIQESYWKRFLLTSIIGYLFAAADEYKVPENIPVIPVLQYAKNPAVLDEYHKDWQKDEALERIIQQNAKDMEKRLIIREFLEHIFQYDPNLHVRSAYEPNPCDDTREIIETPAGKFALSQLEAKDVQFRQDLLKHKRIRALMKHGQSVQEGYTDARLNELISQAPNAQILAKLEARGLKDPNLAQTAYNIIPPADIFHKITNYYEVNWDKLQEVVHNLYCDDPDLDIMFNPYQWHDTKESAIQFMNKHQDDVLATIHMAQSGKWNVVSMHKEVRKNQRFLNDDTKVLKSMLEKQAKETKLARDMMMKRAYIARQKNIEEEGDFDPEIMKAFIQRQRALRGDNSTAEPSNAEYEQYKKEIEESCPEDAVEVQVINLKDGGQSVELKKFYTEAVPTTN